MGNAHAIKVKAVEGAGGDAWVSLLHTVVDLRYKVSFGNYMLQSIPVECLRVSRKKRVKAKWIYLFLFSLVGWPLAGGAALCLLMPEVLPWEIDTRIIILSVIGVSLLPAVFMFYRIWRRDPVIEFSIEGAGVQRFQFWLPLKQLAQKETEALLALIETVRSETVSMHDKPVQEFDMKTAPLAVVWVLLFAQMFLFSIPALMTEKKWLLLFVLFPVTQALRAGVQWWRKPALLRDASRALRRGEWDEALRGLTCFEEQDAARKGRCLLDRLYCMLRLGRFDEAFALLEAQSALVDAEVYRGAWEQLAMTQRVTQRKNGFIGGRWFPGAPKGSM